MLHGVETCARHYRADWGQYGIMYGVSSKSGRYLQNTRIIIVIIHLVDSATYPFTNSYRKPLVHDCTFYLGDDQNWPMLPQAHVPVANNRVSQPHPPWVLCPISFDGSDTMRMVAI